MRRYACATHPAYAPSVSTSARNRPARLPPKTARRRRTWARPPGILDPWIRTSCAVDASETPPHQINCRVNNHKLHVPSDDETVFIDNISIEEPTNVQRNPQPTTRSCKTRVTSKPCPRWRKLRSRRWTPAAVVFPSRPGTREVPIPAGGRPFFPAGRGRRRGAPRRHARFPPGGGTSASRDAVRRSRSPPGWQSSYSLSGSEFSVYQLYHWSRSGFETRFWPHRYVYESQSRYRDCQRSQNEGRRKTRLCLCNGLVC